MRRNSSGTLLVLMGAILGLMFLPTTFSEKMRGISAAALTPFWETGSDAKHLVQNGFQTVGPNGESFLRVDEQIQRLQLENQLLSHELNRLEDMFQEEHVLYSQLCDAFLLMPVTKDSKKLSERHSEQMQKLFDMQLQALPARVIYRPPGSWNSFLWINAGSANNQDQDVEVIAKNSPVLVGSSVIGVIDYVGKNQSRVRLLTDSALNPSVRALRGGGQNRMLAEQTERLIEALATRHDLYPDDRKRTELANQLLAFREALAKDASSWFLAKGELRGSKRVLWRTHQYVLHGTGFNYDHNDEEGVARDLRSGKPHDRDSKSPVVPILRVQDLLVTTGMDGLFPPGLRVGTVTKIHPLKEGDSTYEIEAKPTAGNFDDISLVFVLPPWGYNPLDKATTVSR